MRPSGTPALPLMLFALYVTGAGARQAAGTAWQDPSKHDIRFVTVAEGVRLEIVDWGGSERPVVLLAGSGHTAHVYDDFAPKLLAGCCHVYGITRRGFGASSRPSSGYDDQRLADDVLATIEAAKIVKPVLVGHSMSGGEMTTLARQHTDKVAGLVYLDALADLEDDPPADPEWAALQRKMPPGVRPGPVCPPEDRRTFPAFQKSLACRFGFTFPESELRNQFETIAGGPGDVTAPGWVMRAIGQAQVSRRDYSNIRVPVLALMEFPRRPESYTPKNDEERAVIDQFVERGKVIVGRWTGNLTRHVPDARLFDVPDGGHYLWVKREAQVLRDVRAFIAGLPAARSLPPPLEPTAARR